MQGNVVKVVRYPELGNILQEAMGMRTTQQEVAKLCDVTQAYVSKWLSGYARPRPIHLAILAVHFPQLDPEKLAVAAERDPEEVHRHLEKFQFSSHDLEHARADLKNLYLTLVQGNPHLTIKMADDLNDWLRVSSNPSPELLRIRARALFEQTQAYKEILPRHEVWNKTNPIVEKIQDIAEPYEDDEIYALAESCRGDTSYIMKNHAASAQILTNALELNLVKTPVDLAWLLRPLILSLAYLQKSKDGYLKEWRKWANEARGLIEEGQLSHLENVCQLKEALGRSEGLLGLSKSFDTLDEGLSIYAKIKRGKEKAPMRIVQLVRSKLEVIQYLEPTDRLSVESAGTEVIKTAQEYGYGRHERQIYRFLEKKLN